MARARRASAASPHLSWKVVEAQEVAIRLTGGGAVPRLVRHDQSPPAFALPERAVDTYRVESLIRVHQPCFVACSHCDHINCPCQRVPPVFPEITVDGGLAERNRPPSCGKSGHDGAPACVPAGSPFPTSPAGCRATAIREYLTLTNGSPKPSGRRPLTTSSLSTNLLLRTAGKLSLKSRPFMDSQDFR